jgi:hypothetical protein
MERSSKAATPDETVEHLIKRSGRKGYVPIRRSFVQSGRQRKPVPGPAADLLRRHDERGLDLFLLHRALATADPYDVCLDARVWARALNLATPRNTGAVAVSQTWKRLTGTHLLVGKERSGRLLNVRSLREDGSGKPYTPPGKSGRRSEVYFRLPVEYWTEGWHRKLSHAAKTTLLIASSLPADFYLPTERARDWYGLSADSLSRGLAELRRHDLLKSRRERRTAPAAPLGFTVVERHTLRPPFVHLQKRRLQLVETGAA